MAEYKSITWAHLLFATKFKIMHKKCFNAIFSYIYKKEVTPFTHSIGL